MRFASDQRAWVEIALILLLSFAASYALVSVMDSDPTTPARAGEE